MFERIAELARVRLLGKPGYRQELESLHKRIGFAPGDYYSPYPDLEEVRRDAARIFATPRQLPGVELREEDQLTLVERLKAYYPELPFGDDRREGLRYYFVNPYYRHNDAIMLYALMRHLQPRRIAEIGSGFSSAVMLDTNELFFDNSISLTFVEPFPERLRSQFKPGDHERVTLLEQRVQDVPVDAFATLGAGDILFVDSSHVSKTGSDLNYILFDILPRLQPGVHIHFHDIYYPFEYPPEWVYEGRAWNEAYLLRAFLQYNHAFEIVLFNRFISDFHPEAYAEMPLCLVNRGSSLWLRRK